MAGWLTPVLAEEPRGEIDPSSSLRRAVEDLVLSCGDRYPDGPQYLDRLGELQRQLRSADGDRREQLENELQSLRRRALVANPLLRGRTVLLVVRPQYWGYHGPINTMFQNGEIQQDTFRGGGAMKTIRFGPGGDVAEVKTLLEAPEGIARDPEVSFDGRRIVFAMRKNKADDYHVYEIGADGSGLKQLTFGSKLSDVEPVYLPDGRIAFNSTRDLKFCQCNRHPMGNLFAMDADGANMVQIGGSTLWEGHPSLLSDGRLLYSRWDYVDRQFGPSFGLWTCNPDGTAHALCYGNNAWTPGSILDGHAIPGTQNIVCIFGACHDLPWGAMAIVDRRRGLDGSEPVTHIWPANARGWLENQKNVEWHPGQIDAFTRTRPKYEDPRPLSDKHFLVARTLTEDVGQSMQMGIFLVDVFGNELLLHTEKPGCYDPMPVAPRPRAPILPTRNVSAEVEGSFYLSDVYQGAGMGDVPRGAIKYLRIVEAPAKRAWSRAGGGGIDADQAPLMNWNLTNNKRIIGDVPVEADGSAYFAVPANTFVYFQALDADKMMIQSMRSGTFVQPGERVGCVGCHEHQLHGAAARSGVAWTRTPSQPEPWYGPPRAFNYLTEVQPVFDKHCVNCHDYGKEAGEDLNLAGDVGLLFNASYLELHRRSAVRWFPDPPDGEKLLIKAVHDGPPAVLPAYSWGSYRSRLIDVVRGEHYEAKLSREEIERIATWIDLNAPYYGSYASVYPNNPFGRSPLSQGQLDGLARLAGRGAGDFKHDPALQISFSRPELSPVLDRIEEESRRKEALSIIVAGGRQLAELPREDMLGPSSRPRIDQDVDRADRYQAHVAAEAAAREAMRDGRKVFRNRDGDAGQGRGS